MDQDEKISVVIPAYKNEATIERAVMSALSQTYGNVEVVAVDDGSPDKTGEILDKLAGEHENLLVIHKENGGVSAARNDGIRKASGQWLVTLDGDDYMDDIMLERLHEAAVRGQSELVICGFRKVYPNGYREVFRPETELITDKESMINTMFTELYDRHLMSTHSNKLYSLELIRKESIYYDQELQINEDIDFCFRYLSHCSTVAVIKGAYLNYVQHEAGQSLINRFHENGLKSCFKVLRAYDELFDPLTLEDTVINDMNNRMLQHFCSFAGLMYYQSDYSEEKKLAVIQELCGEEAFQKLLAQTTPVGLKNRTAHFLLSRKKARAYHELCKLLYFKKANTAEAGEPVPELAAAEPATPEETAPETTASEAAAAEPVEETAEESVEASSEETEKSVEEIAEESTAETVAEPAGESTEAEESDEEATETESTEEAVDEETSESMEETAEEEAVEQAEEEAEEATEEESDSESIEELVVESVEASSEEPTEAEPAAEAEEPAAEADEEATEAESTEEKAEEEPEETEAPEVAAPEKAEEEAPEEAEPEYLQETLPLGIEISEPEEEAERKVEIRSVFPEEEAAEPAFLSSEAEAGQDTEAIFTSDNGGEAGASPDTGLLNETEKELSEEEQERIRKRRRRRRMARKPHERNAMEGQIEMWDILRANGTLDGITDDELEAITKKLEESVRS